MADVDFHIDKAKLENLAFSSESTRSLVSQETSRVRNNATALSAGFRTKRLSHNNPPVGGTAPVWKSDVKKFRNKYVGIVVTGNYSAMKDNHLHNTLLKAL